jgi:hypothetical protein
MKAPQKSKKSSHRNKSKNLTWGDLFDATYRACREEGVPNFSSGSSNRFSGRKIAS